MASPRPDLRPIVFKLGGAAHGEGDAALDLAAARHAAGEPVVVVHGGGALVGEWSRRFGIEPRFDRGLRVTDEPTRDIALAVLTGIVNKRLVAALARRGSWAVGVSGADGALLATRRARPELGLVGEVEEVRPRLVAVLLDAGALPVVAPAALGPDGELVNVNADGIAGALAAALGARLLVFVTDVPGVRGADGAVLPTLDPRRIARLSQEGVIAGGMLPKLEACCVAAAAGCVAAIVHARDRAGMERLVAGGAAGTVVATETVA